jgi:hypothetical protein
MNIEQDEIVAELHRYRKQRQEEFGNNAAAMIAAFVLEEKKLEEEGWTFVPAPGRPRAGSEAHASANQG